MLDILQEMKDDVEELIEAFRELKGKLNQQTPIHNEIPDNELPAHLP